MSNPVKVVNIETGEYKYFSGLFNAQKFIRGKKLWRIKE